MIRILLVALAICTLAMIPAAATLADVSCPQTISVEQKATAPNDWSVDYFKTSAELSSITIFDGPPEEQASLKYDDERSTKAEIVQTWDLATNERGYWIVCGYAHTTAELRRKLPNEVHACEAVFEKGVTFGGGGMVAKRVRCTAGEAHAPTH